MRKKSSTIINLILTFMLVFSLGVYASQDTGTDLPDAPGDGPANVSSVVSVGNVPLITLNNGVQVPQLGLGTQIQSLERQQ